MVTSYGKEIALKNYIQYVDSITQALTGVKDFIGNFIK